MKNLFKAALVLGFIVLAVYGAYRLIMRDREDDYYDDDYYDDEFDESESDLAGRIRNAAENDLTD